LEERLGRGNRVERKHGCGGQPNAVTSAGTPSGPRRV
jgi:hypothetical protein